MEAFPIFCNSSLIILPCLPIRTPLSMTILVTLSAYLPDRRQGVRVPCSYVGSILQIEPEVSTNYGKYQIFRFNRPRLNQP
ncbi:MAG: hypothetical protein MRJ65_09120 [Candidatus Brocadiaceae bacterium]|nr:hypothetical protein [Candidatus Brocadiaceae bacterium]